MSKDKSKAIYKGNHPYYLQRKEIEVVVGEGQHVVGILVGTHNMDADGQFVNNTKMSQEEFMGYVTGDEVVIVKQNNHKSGVGMYEYSMYFVPYVVEESSFYKPTHICENYEGDVNIEIMICFPEENNHYTKIFNYQYTSAQSTDSNVFCVSPITLGRQSVEDMLTELKNDLAQGFYEYDGDVYIDVYDKAGLKTEMLVGNDIDELIDAVVSIRLV